MIIGNVSREHAPKVERAEHDHGLQALPSNAPDETFRIRILPRTPWGREDFLDVQARRTSAKDLAIDAIAVPQEIPGRRPPGDSLDQLPGGPPGGRMLGDIEEENASAIMREDDESPPVPRA